MLRANGIWGQEHKPLIKQCKGMMDQEVKLSHCYCKANRVANKLANLGIDSSIVVAFFKYSPKDTTKILYANVVGATSSKKVN